MNNCAVNGMGKITVIIIHLRKSVMTELLEVTYGIQIIQVIFISVLIMSNNNN